MNQDLIQLLLPEGLFEYFEVIKVEKVDNSYNIHITELNLIPKEFEGQKLESKGYFEEETVRDFPLRGKACFLKIKRRKWLNHDTGKIVAFKFTTQIIICEDIISCYVFFDRFQHQPPLNKTIGIGCYFSFGCQFKVSC